MKEKDGKVDLRTLKRVTQAKKTPMDTVTNAIRDLEHDFDVLSIAVAVFVPAGDVGLIGWDRDPRAKDGRFRVMHDDGNAAVPLIERSREIRTKAYPHLQALVDSVAVHPLSDSERLAFARRFFRIVAPIIQTEA